MVEIEYKNTRVKLGATDLVYEPAEDSFLLADATLEEAEPGMHILEIGAGSGFVSAVLRANIKGIRVLATEINPHAARCAKANGVEVIRTDLFKGLKPENRKTSFDLILFNPPYLPTSEEEKVPGWLNYAFDGGASGRETLDRFLDEVRNYLSPGGKILVLISSITGLEAVKEKMEKLGFEVDIVGRKKISFEELMVVRGKIL
ncbi:modification methylase HemK [Methanosarcina sp. 2.H.T.1A.6]|uniref:HemK2/MTQ2 family protein methyltransferase n=1 Tax=unclassified Methanosarcina TaxID=2644672 RepID=UPI0006216E94|nr:MULTISPECIES: HemK2/MTQ2 family protein methyltransferase [unclassified Methanosarcina]KKG10569.1 modification methylase HemK [Methanosarcina sp. 2.H.T.1A.15]KKG17072.1 modification methylase HemK [Methanosarcina sp. 2.H.T.1A.3]KKG20305.1 modification methylase HemK [Methanosarcina sp. 2.H.T.1A.6]KKG23431.1 modification methylase HemK [Methanosarcina sp. 2.H.T.1A.8]